MILRCSLLLLIFFTPPLSMAASQTALVSSEKPDSAFASADTLINKQTIVTTIRPLHSLLSSIMQGTGTPVLLIDSNQSPHHYSLRPSQRSTLAHSDILFWVGDELESFMPRVLNAIPKKVKVIELIEASGLTLLEPRRDGKHNHHHDAHHDGDHDAHIWLSIDNAIVMANVMASTLSQFDKNRENIYQSNLTKLTKRLAQLKKDIQHNFKTSNFNYLVYHDAFQYFENLIHTKPLAAITTDEEQAPGMRHLSEINQLISKNKINCLIYNTSSVPAIVRNLSPQKGMKMIYLEPLGQDFKPGPDLYFDLLKSLATGYQQCRKAD